jgi:hypothetical protein
VSEREDRPHGRVLLLALPGSGSSERPRRQRSPQNIFLVVLSLMASFAISGCSGGPVIDAFSADYRVTQGSAGDAQLLFNILRAKDDLPIHFSDLSVIHGSLQMTAATGASIPVANVGTNATTIAPLLTGQSAPTFDVGTLDTQDFTRGMLTPINPQVIKQFFDQGIDPRIIMLLFFSEYRDLKSRVYLNNMSCDRSRPLNAKGECLNRIYGFLSRIDDLFLSKGLAPIYDADAFARVSAKGHHLHANVYQVLRPVGGWLPGDWSLKDNIDQLRQLDPTKHKLIGRQLYSISDPRLAICYEINGTLTPLFPSPHGNRACNNSELIAHDSPRQAGTLFIRSTYEVIQFLGQVLRFQEEKGNNRCLTLGKEREERRCDTGEVLFQVNAPVGTAVVGTRYGGGWYGLYDRRCNRNLDEHCDYSLQVLALLQILLNYNKAAKDIVAIPRVQVVQ